MLILINANQEKAYSDCFKGIKNSINFEDKVLLGMKICMKMQLRLLDHRCLQRVNIQLTLQYVNTLMRMY